MGISTGGFGPVHVDCPNDDLWEQHGYASSSIIIDSGGSDMIYMVDGQKHVGTDDVFFFNDCVPHGVPPVTRQRLMLRINGKVDYPQYRELMQLERAVG